ncbi:methyltransferase domain-containing protein [Ditylenchus destructor]|nr:methyltransferase domain-containing protein [Ditylenchus destructor]
MVERGGMSSNAFLDHVVQAVRRPLAKAEFEAGYHQLLSEVQSAQTWDLNGLLIASPPGSIRRIPGAPRGSSSTASRRWTGAGPPPGQRLLEVGCGSGAVALWAARLGWSVSAGDLLPACVEAARRNALANGLAIDVRRPI